MVSSCLKNQMMYNLVMNLELPSKTAKTLEQIMLSLGTSREEAMDRALNSYLEDITMERILIAPNPRTQNMTEDDVYEIATAAVKRARAEKREKKR
jgi:hypothetical protein